MDEERPVTIATVGHTISTWFGIVGGIFSFICACVLVGVWFGSLKDLPTQVSELKSFQFRHENVVQQVTSLAAEQIRIRDDIREIAVDINELKITSIQKVDFLEWKAVLERQNNIIAPPLKKNP